MRIFSWFNKKSKKVKDEETEKVEKDKSTDLFENAPFLSPWYFSQEKPNLSVNSSLLKWNFIEKQDDEYLGIITLKNGENILGLVDSYTYVKALSSGKEFCIWGGSKNIKGKICQTLEIYTTESLKEIDTPQQKMKELKSNKRAYYLFNANPKSKTTIELNPRQDVMSHIFPPEFKDYSEIILVLNIPKLYEEREKGWQDCALVVLKPNENKVQIYPQDWFNQDTRMDFGYQWITRAFRNTETNSIWIEGIRLAKYELDESNRKVKRML